MPYPATQRSDAVLKLSTPLAGARSFGVPEELPIRVRVERLAALSSLDELLLCKGCCRREDETIVFAVHPGRHVWLQDCLDLTPWLCY